jgi:hypothetical protein
MYTDAHNANEATSNFPNEPVFKYCNKKYRNKTVMHVNEVSVRSLLVYNMDSGSTE